MAGVVGQKHCSAYGATKFAVEGLSLATAQEVEQFGIKVTVVEPGFFLTDLLDAGNVRYADSTIADYAHEGTAEAMWSPYDGQQTGSPDKLGDALVETHSPDGAAEGVCRRQRRPGHGHACA